jgi:oligopeptide/dipeptide ABC transporter ATP-binding protein
VSLLEVLDLSVALDGGVRPRSLVRDVSFDVDSGSVLAIVGESGSGKTLTARSLIGLVGPGLRVSGSVTYAGRQLVGVAEKELRGVRGGKIGMVSQDAMTAMNPVLRIGDQIAEALRAHSSFSRRQAATKAVDLLREVGITDPERAAESYPHQLSGGMRQRALIAMALGCEPELLIADEPTTALDVTIQAQVIELLRALVAERDLGMIFITHDLGLVAEVADRVLVMYSGRVVEYSSTAEIFRDPRHPYTRGLIASSPRADRPPQARMRAIPGSPPSDGQAAAGCVFRPRCAEAFEACGVEPGLERRGTDAIHLDRCWLNQADVVGAASDAKGKA